MDVTSRDGTAKEKTMVKKSLFDKVHLQWFGEGDEKPFEEMTQEELVSLIKETKEAFDKTQQELERTKKAQSGSDREVQKKEQKLAELEKKIEEMEKEHMSEDERKQKKLEEQERLIQEREEKIKQSELKELKRNLLKKAGLPDRFVGRIVGQNEEEIQSDIEEFKKEYTEEVGVGVEQEIKNRFGDKKPPKSAERSGEITYQDLLNMSDEEQRQYTPQQIQEIINKG